MISTHFLLSFLIKIDILYPESVVCKSRGMNVALEANMQ